MARQDSKQVVNIKIGDSSSKSKKKKRASKRKVSIKSMAPLASGPSLGSSGMGGTFGGYLGPYIPVSANNAPVRIEGIGPPPTPTQPRITSISAEAPQSTQVARDVEIDSTPKLIMDAPREFKNNRLMSQTPRLEDIPIPPPFRGGGGGGPYSSFEPIAPPMIVPRYEVTPIEENEASYINEMFNVPE